jgi:hypothetical protein
VFNGPEAPMMVLFLSVAAIVIMRGPFGRALAERLSGRARPGAEDQDVRELKSEVDELRTQLADVQERLDYAERVLARREERAGALPKGAGEAR